jgi:hypothetical protein
VIGADYSRPLEERSKPTEVSTDRAPTYPQVLDELLPLPPV